MTMKQSQLFLELIVEFYIHSDERFNGIPLHTLLELTKLSWDDALPILIDLVEVGKVTLCFASVSINPHIKRLPDLPTDKQVEILRKEGPEYVCAYPTSEIVKERADASQYDDRPFTEELLLGAAQLTSVFFDMAALERYYNDPRYHFSFTGFGGSLGISDKFYFSDKTRDRDKVGLKTFGLGFDENGNRVVVVYLCYLANLTSEHQQYWNTYKLTAPCKVVEEYYRTSILGKFPQYYSIYGAFIRELEIINEMCGKMEKPDLFRRTFKNNGPREFGFFFRPTLTNYNRFIHLLDKMLSENINLDFFAEDVSLEEEIKRANGRIEVRRRNSIAILDEWLKEYIRDPEEGVLDKIVKPMRDVRRQRQSPAHKIEEDTYDTKYFDLQREVMERCYTSARYIRLLFANHPWTTDVEVPEWLYKGRIKNP